MQLPGCFYIMTGGFDVWRETDSLRASRGSRRIVVSFCRWRRKSYV